MQPTQAASSPNAQDSVRVIRWLTMLVLLAAGATIRFLHLSSKPFWFDECFGAEVARIGWSNFLHLLWWREANMSLYYLLLRIWVGIGTRLGWHSGQSEFFIRSLSVVIASATLPAIYWLARRLYDRRVAWIAAALFAFNAYSVRYAQEARSYALFLLLATLSSGFLIAYIREPGRRSWWGYVLVSILAVYAHFYALLLVAAHWLALRGLKGESGDGSGASGFTETRRSGTPRTGMRPVGMRRAWITIGVAVLPLLVFVAKTGAGPIRWISRPGLRDLGAFYEHLAGSEHWPLPVLFAVAGMAAVLPVWKRLWACAQDWATWRTQFLLIWLFFPVALTALLSFARPVFLGRYMIFCLPALLILVAAGLARLRKSWLLAAVLAAILLLSSQGILFVYSHDFDNERDASGAAADFILDQARAGDAVVFHIAEARVPYEFFRSERAGENTASPEFAAALGPEIVFPRHGPGLDYRDFTGKPAPDLLRAIGASHERVWVMLMNNSVAGTPDATTAMLTQVLPESFPRIERWEFRKVEVRLYSKQ